MDFDGDESGEVREEGEEELESELEDDDEEEEEDSEEIEPEDSFPSGWCGIFGEPDFRDSTGKVVEFEDMPVRTPSKRI